MSVLRPDVCVIGAGTAGVSVALGAAQLGARVVLIEGRSMGGDSLNYGCVPSKALLACAQAYHSTYVETLLGVKKQNPPADESFFKKYVEDVIATLAPQDSQERMRAAGVQVIRDNAAFSAPDTLLAGKFTIKARFFVIATGSEPQLPELEGLSRVPYLTNETLFQLEGVPEHLIVLGGGPLGVEMAQAYLRLGSKVTLLQRSSLLVREDPEAVAYVRKRLEREGLVLFENVVLEDAGPCEQGSAVCIGFSQNGDSKLVRGSHLLVAVGRRPRLASLNLDAARVEYTAAGIQVSSGLRTSNRIIYAIGDVLGQEQLTHVANAHAEVVLKRMLLRLPARFKPPAVPWVTYTDPEIAQAGPTERMLKLQGRHDYTVFKKSFEANDRAVTQRATAGFIKILLSSSGHLLSVTLVGPQAGELLLPWLLLIHQKLKPSALSRCIVPYPTLSELSKALAQATQPPSALKRAWARLMLNL